MHSTIVDLLRQRAHHQPQQTAYTFLKDGETKAVSLTYQTLDQQAQIIASWLQTQYGQGDRVLLVYPYDAGLEFIAAFLGCLYAGIVAVACHPPRNRAGLIELYTRSTSAEVSAILTTQTLLPKLKAQLASGQFSVSADWCATDQLVNSPNARSNWQPPALASDTLAFLQYTSGSTGTPKGVMVTHAALMHNQQLLQLAFGHTEHSVGVGWLPLFHDMGLIGNVLQALYLGASCVLMSPIDFVQKPMRWLQAISRYKATTSGAPNFAYDLLCRKVSDDQLQQLDLSRWEVAFTGAEPVRIETLDRFSQKFAVCGFRKAAFYPCYGMAEATLFISGGQKLTPTKVLQVEEIALEQNRITVAQNSEASRCLVSCGHAWLDTQVKIVDPQSLQPCQPDQIGEIWVSGSGLGTGYWNQPEQTQRTFYAQIDNQIDDQNSTSIGTYLRTGDLGFLYSNELFVTGRLNDVLVFWGFNHYPQHIEQTVEACHAGFKADGNAAFSVKINHEERLVIVQEVERSYRNQIAIEEVVELIRWNVFEQHFIDVYGIVLLKPGSLPKTSSGKVQRSACRALYLTQELDAIGQWQSSDPYSDPNSTMERYFKLETHIKRYTHLTKGRIQRWMGAVHSKNLD